MRRAFDEESHRVSVDEVHFSEVEDDIGSTFLVKASAQVGQLFGADSSAQGQCGPSRPR